MEPGEKYETPATSTFTIPDIQVRDMRSSSVSTLTNDVSASTRASKNTSELELAQVKKRLVDLTGDQTTA